MRVAACLSACLAAMIVPLSCAAQQAPLASDVGLSVGREQLSNGSPDWRETQIQFNHRLAPRHLFGMSIGQTERFGLRDSQLGANYVLPLRPDLTVSVEGGASGTHRVLPRHVLGAGAQWEFAPAWLLHAGARESAYEDVHVNQGMLMLERYAGNASASLAWRPARALGTTAHAFEARGNYYYGERSAIGLILAAGEEAANVAGAAPGTAAVVITRVKAAALTGHHWLDRRWAVNYGISRTRQGDLYSRNGINLGLQYAF
ncbi:YaiO family outer membrane beta-barrel protein [Noviherbaspirillum galbum]|uniref:YaiO family outer membrane beta-barrel protein n=1 Tax=Noviherbaspirillum galbum TaxID=2709383 RepID=A0A6B3SI37_9BURK|nr:YaiO family outer membrane beta-barrel protein [Noviherbaspirillum galbum]NEX60343.1 YaiO family outer membrane beta-barrel protein [Noviherbaspirillum galbum]